MRTQRRQSFFVYASSRQGTTLTFFEQNDGGGRNMYSIAGVPLHPTLQVNTDTGELTIVNETNGELDFNYYEIVSPDGSLDQNDWNSLDSRTWAMVPMRVKVGSRQAEAAR